MTYREKITDTFLPGPGQSLINSILTQMSLVPQFIEVFGPFTVDDENQRWSDYCRFDWSLRQLPAISLFEKDSENKTTTNGWLEGTAGIQVFWPANFRRSDLSRIPSLFKAAVQNFFESDLANQLFSIVPGLNKIGAEINWQPNTEGLVEAELVPVTLIDIKYKIDLRQWYRFLETDYRTKGQPFVRTLDDLSVVALAIHGLTEQTGTSVQDEVDVTLDV
jgi:hypothetical protein